MTRRARRTRKTRRARGAWRALTAALTILVGLVGLSSAGASPAFAGLDGPVAANLDQHCGVNSIGSGTTTIAVPVDRVTLNLEAAGHEPAGASIIAVYTVPGTSKYGTLFGQFDPVRANVTFDYTVTSPPAGATLRLDYEVSWTDGTYYTGTQSRPLLHCTLANTTDSEAAYWNNFVEAGVSQRCTTVDLGVRGRHAYVRADVVTVNIAHGAPYSADGYAGQPVWADYWIPNSRGYTSGASGTFDSTGHATVTFQLIAPPTGAELDVLASGRVSFGGRTFPAHKWVTIAC